jgi:hypothetical protein
LKRVALVLVQDGVSRLLVVRALQLAHSDVHAVAGQDVTLFECRRRVSRTFQDKARGCNRRDCCRPWCAE